ncbi:MAG: hypothetical protein WCA20_18945 [Candidatus Sulfotelmatobacter sp.]
MSRFYVCVAVLLVAEAAVFAPSHAAATVTTKVAVAISGSSAAWVDLALAAYNGGHCAAPAPAGSHCLHYTDNSSGFDLNDTRPTKLSGGTPAVDVGHIWIVWSTPTSGTQYVWLFLKVDSIVGDRCYFGTPRCGITVPSGYSWSGGGSLISASLWGADATEPPAAVQALFGGSGITVNTAATDIRPEDAQFEACRVNSKLGDGTAGGSDGLDGLGYNANNPSGTCASYPVSLAEGVGTPIKSGLDRSVDTTKANVLAFNISGKDPFSGDTVAAGTTLNIGAAPLVFVISRSSTANHGLTGCAGKLCDITDAGAQAIFSGANCSADEVTASGAALPAAPLNAFLREPESGTMTVAEEHVFRRPTDTLTHKTLGVSQETGVDAATLSYTKCKSGIGTRTRGIGTSEVINGYKNAAGAYVASTGILNSGGTSDDGIAYTFWGFGNINKIWDSPNYSYLTLDGVDPIGPFTGSGGPWEPGEIPNCTAPCPESDFWKGQSFPGLRSGDYPAWALLHLVTAEEIYVEDLLTVAYTQAVDSEPDFIPDLATKAGGISDPGVTIFKTHYQERTGGGVAIGAAPSNGAFSGGYRRAGTPPKVAVDKGGDAGGCTVQIAAITSATYETDYIQADVTQVDGTSHVTCSKDRN